MMAEEQNLRRNRSGSTNSAVFDGALQTCCGERENRATSAKLTKLFGLSKRLRWLLIKRDVQRKSKG
jgi:hypothetical protein